MAFGFGSREGSLSSGLKRSLVGRPIAADEDEEWW